MPKDRPIRTQEDIDFDEAILQEQNIEAKLKDQLDEPTISSLKKLCYLISKVGMSIEEACKVISLDFKDVVKLSEKNKTVKTLLEMKELSYKKDLMTTVSQKARTTDDKIAMWLLERRYPTEFGAKKSISGESNVNILVQAMQYIQDQGDNSPLISKTSSMPIQTPMRRIPSPLSGTKGPINLLKKLLGDNE